MSRLRVTIEFYTDAKPDAPSELFAKEVDLDDPNSALILYDRLLHGARVTAEIRDLVLKYARGEKP